MAFPKKKSRKITVDKHDYLWIAQNATEVVNLSIISEKFNGQKLFAQFDYNTVADRDCNTASSFKIIPSVVRETILIGIKNGYSPTENKKDFNLGNLSKKLSKKLIGKFKIEIFLALVGHMIDNPQENIDSEVKASIFKIIDNTHELVAQGEWYGGFENVLNLLKQKDQKLTDDVCDITIQIFVHSGIDWKEEWGWITDLRIHPDMIF